MKLRFNLTTVSGICVTAISASAAMSCGSTSDEGGRAQVGGSSSVSTVGGAATTSANSTGGASATPTASGGSATNSSASNGVGGSPSTGGAPATGGKASVGGGVATGGKAESGGAPATGGFVSAGGRSAFTTRVTGGRSGGGTSATSGATGGTLPQAGAVSSNGADCTKGIWPASDPAAAGPFATVTENNVGPEAGVGAAGAAGAPQFTMFRPKDMAQGGLCHPVVTWGNGTSANPSMYKVLLNHLASHGFVVIASNSPNVLQGSPAPMLVGVTWVLAQNDDPASVLYHRIDTAHIGATGHSQGAMATAQASGDSHIVASVPIEGANPQKNLHGPAMFFCGGLDDIVGCNGAQSAINAVTTVPAMFAEYLSVDHGSWLTFVGNKPSVVETAVTAWMRVHLMDDTALRSWFYGPSCKLCTDSGWTIIQKNMDQ
ncbi:MAG TPA: hypothetical protein VIV60_05300 [Polyangiaceae bacterium]